MRAVGFNIWPQAHLDTTVEALPPLRRQTNRSLPKNFKKRNKSTQKERKQQRGLSTCGGTPRSSKEEEEEEKGSSSRIYYLYSCIYIHSPQIRGHHKITLSVCFFAGLSLVKRGSRQTGRHKSLSFSVGHLLTRKDKFSRNIRIEK